jgi:cell division protein FtsZ
MIGLGESDAPGDERIQEAIDQALNSPLLEVDISEANGVLIDVIGGTDMTISEAEHAAEEIQSRVGANARIIWGAAIDPAMDKTVRIMLVATGVKSKQILGKPPAEKRFRGVGEVDLVR